jgi:hypothetical protein
MLSTFTKAGKVLDLSQRPRPNGVSARSPPAFKYRSPAHMVYSRRSAKSDFYATLPRSDTVSDGEFRT